mgnify:CR=1 FL=1
MAMVVRAPEDKEKKVYLDSVFEVARGRKIRCGVLTKDVYVGVDNNYLLLRKGDYVMFYDNKRDVVQNLGVKLKERGYKVLLIDELTINLLRLLR